MGLYDYWQKLFKREAPEKNSSEYSALYERVDLENFFSKLNYYYDAELILNKVSGRETLTRLYDTDAEIMAAVDKRLGALMTCRLEIEGTNEPLRLFFEKQIKPFEYQLKEDFWWAVPYGYSVVQIIYNPDLSGNVMGYQREKFWRFNPQPDLLHVTIRSSANPSVVKNDQLLPYGKWVLTTHKGTSYNPRGVAIFARIYLPWLFRCSTWDFWMRFAERFAGGFLVGKSSEGSFEKVNQMRQALDKAAKSASIAVTKEDEVSMISPVGDGLVYKNLDDQLVNIYLRAILGETQTSKIQERGSSQSAEVHDGIRAEKTMSDMRLVEKSMNELIKHIATVNQIPIDENLPVAKLFFEDGLETDRAERDAILKNSGITSFTPEYLKRHFGFKDDEIIEAPQTFPGLGFTPDKKTIGLSHACKSCGGIDFAKDVSNNANEIEDVIQLLKKAKLSPLRQEDLFAVVTASKSKEELTKNLGALFDQDSPEYSETLTQALYYVSAIGIKDANK